MFTLAQQAQQSFEDGRGGGQEIGRCGVLEHPDGKFHASLQHETLKSGVKSRPESLPKIQQKISAGAERTANQPFITI